MLRAGAAAAAANEHGAAAIHYWAAGARRRASPRLGRVPDVRDLHGSAPGPVAPAAGPCQ